MSGVAEAVYAWLDGLGIPYRRAEHAPAHTMEDCAEVDRTLGALTVKNIFLTTKNGKRFYLCLTRPDVRFHTADISRQAGSSRLSFAPEEKLFEKLRARAGSASPMGLIFPEAAGVGLLVDSALLDVPVLAFHPCDNTRTLAMSGADFFEKFLPSVGVEPCFVAIHDFLDRPGSAAEP